MSDPVLEVKNLSVRFFLEEEKTLLPALNQISFHVDKNEVLGIIGESGSGKSITLLSILGLLQTNPGIIDGEIIVNTKEDRINTLQDIHRYIKIDNFEQNNETVSIDVKAWKKSLRQYYRTILGRYISMVFQNPRLAFNPYYSIGKQINESVRLRNPELSKAQSRQKSIDWLRKVKMEAADIRYNNNPYGLSGGLCQRAMIAMALASEPDLLIADEPTTGLDATIQGDILALLEELKHEEKISMILVSHDFNVMQRLSDRILVYYKGHVIEQGTTNEILDYSSGFHHPYTALLLKTEFDVNSSQTPPREDKVAVNSFSQCPYIDRCTSVSAEIIEKCRSSLPPLIDVTPSHKIRCWKFEK